MQKPKILFVFDHQYENLWRDGLWAALKLLEKDFEITYCNLYGAVRFVHDADFILGWGGFNSPVDAAIKEQRVKKGLCLGGYGFTPHDNYNVIFYECEWAKNWLLEHNVKTRFVHAFGVNTDIYQVMEMPKLYEYLSVGSFALWKRQIRMIEKTGSRMVVGEIQKGNPQESLSIALALIREGVAVSDMVSPEKLALYYNLAKNVYIPADINGGGERAVLEARACGVPVVIEGDNPKLQELLTSPVYDHHYYASQLKQGILSVL